MVDEIANEKTFIEKVLESIKININEINFFKIQK